MPQKLTNIFICFLILFCQLAIQAQVVVAQVSSKQVQAGVPFDYAIVINTNPNGYAPPSFGGLSVVGGPNQSSSMQWVNGQTSTQLTLSWAPWHKKKENTPLVRQ